MIFFFVLFVNEILSFWGNYFAFFFLEKFAVKII